MLAPSDPSPVGAGLGRTLLNVTSRYDFNCFYDPRLCWRSRGRDRRMPRLPGVAPAGQNGVLAGPEHGLAGSVCVSAHAHRERRRWPGLRHVWCIYIVASLVWMWLVEGQRPDRWDLTGGFICLDGAAVILLTPRA